MKSPTVRFLVASFLFILCEIVSVFPLYVLSYYVPKDIVITPALSIYIAITALIGFIFGAIVNSLWKSNRDTALDDMGEIQLAEFLARGEEFWKNKYHRERRKSYVAHMIGEGDGAVIAARIKSEREGEL